MKTQPTPAADELARVADLHRQLDRLARDTEGGVYSSNFTLLDLKGVRHTYTAAEIADWLPKIKPALVAALKDYRGWDGYAWGKSLGDNQACAFMNGKAADAYLDHAKARGLYMTTELLRVQLPQSPAVGGKGCAAWREVDRNGAYAHWRNGERECVLALGRDPGPCDGNIPGYQARLGEQGWQYRTGDHDWMNAGSYIPRSTQPEQAKAAAVEAQTGLLRGVPLMHPENGKTVVIGTPFRSGKSAFQEKLAAAARARGEQVAVLRPEREYRTSIEGEWRRWDSDAYHGIPTSNLDERIAAAKQEVAKEMPREVGPRFPHPGRNFALKDPK